MRPLDISVGHKDSAHTQFISKQTWEWGGGRTSHMLDIIYDVIAYAPDIVILSGGRNDVSHGVGLSYSTNHITGILNALAVAGIAAVVMNVTPRAIAEPENDQEHRRQLNDCIGRLPDDFPGAPFLMPLART
jgi:hypothetical protein